MRREVRSIYFSEDDLDVLEFIDEQSGKFSPTVIQMVRDVKDGMTHIGRPLATNDETTKLLMELLQELQVLKAELQMLKMSAPVVDSRQPQHHIQVQQFIKRDLSEMDNL